MSRTKNGTPFGIKQTGIIRSENRMYAYSCSQYGSPSLLSTVFILFSLYRLIMSVKNYLHTDHVIQTPRNHA